MKNERINLANQNLLLQIARQSLERFVRERKSFPVDAESLDPILLEKGASFVTLHRFNRLRGCIGTLTATQPLYLDVAEHAIAAGTQDFRFHPVTPEELSALVFEISVLSQPQPLLYSSPDDLLQQLKPGTDGVVLVSGFHRATFLPQVWQSIPEKEEFLSQLCIKMGVSAQTWRKGELEVLTYEVQEFSE